MFASVVMAAAIIAQPLPSPQGPAPSYEVKITRNFAAEYNARVLAVPEAQRAWPRYREATELLADDFKQFDPDALATPGDEQWPALVEFTKKHAAAIEQIRRASELPALGYITTDASDEDAMRGTADVAPRGNPRVNELKFYAIGRCRMIVRVLRADAIVARERREGARVADDLLSMLRVGNHVFGQPMVVAGPVGFAVLTNWCDLFLDTVARCPELFEEADLRAIFVALEGFAGGGLLRMPVAPMRDEILDFVQRAYTDDGAGDGRMTDAGVAELDRLAAPAEPVEPRGSLRRMLDEQPLFRQRFWATIATRRQLLDEAESLFARCAARDPFWRRDQWGGIPDDPEWKTKFAPLAILSPGYLYPQRSERTIQLRDAALVVIAIDLYRREARAWPESLDRLVPRFIRSIPPDRIDGNPLRYRLGPDGPVLYSMGADEDDDGGRPTDPPGAASDWRSFKPRDPPDGDWVLWRPGKS